MSEDLIARWKADAQRSEDNPFVVGQQARRVLALIEANARLEAATQMSGEDKMAMIADAEAILAEADAK